MAQRGSEEARIQQLMQDGLTLAEIFEQNPDLKEYASRATTAKPQPSGCAATPERRIPRPKL